MPGPPQIVPSEDALTVFADGASLPSPRRGGVGIRFVHCDHLGNETFFDFAEPGYTGATNNQMELQAVIAALRAIQGGRLPAHMLAGISKVELFTDSAYVADNVGNAVYEWPSSRWMTRSGAPVLNADLWKELVKQYKRVRQSFRLEIKWGKGHSASNPHNKTADKLAKQSARQATRTLGRPVSVRRKTTSKSTQAGSVEMLGQRLTIRIVTAEPVPSQRGLSRYRYEVVSRGSPFFGSIDFAYSDDPTLRPGHTYYVTMGKDAGNPQIVKCHWESTASKPA
jgi:ribonuclease HI